MKKFLLLLPIFFLFYSEVTYCQTPVTSHINEKSIRMNSALAGFYETTKFEANYRNHLPGIKNTFTTYRFSLDGQIESINSGIGVQVLKDDEGDNVFNNLSIDLIYSYKIKVGRNSAVSFGLNTSFTQNKLSFGGLNLPDVSFVQNSRFYEDENGFAENSLSMNFGSGVHGNINNSHTGFYVSKFGLMTFSGNPQKEKFLLSGYYFHKIVINNAGMGSYFNLTPGIHIRKQGPLLQTTFGLDSDISNIIAGVWIRNSHFSSFNSSTIILKTGINYLNLKLVYSADVGINNFISEIENFGSHEVTIMYNLRYKGKRNSHKAIKCPKI